MTEPHPQYGCPGDWYVTISSNNYPNYEYGAYSGYENDNPTLQNLGYTYAGQPCVSLVPRAGAFFGDPAYIYVSSSPTIVSTRFVRDPSCTPTPPSIKYDCINGACLPSTTYNTPGLYNSLSECEVACGTGCSGKCISNEDWAKIEGLANQLKSKNCS